MTTSAGTPWRALLRPGLPSAELETTEHVVAQAGLSTAGMLVQGLARFVISVVVGNVFGPAVLGSVNAGISLALFASLLVPTAAAGTVTKYVALLRGAGRLHWADRVIRALGAGTGLATVLLGIGTTLAVAALTDLGPLGCLLAGGVAVAYSGYVYLRGALFGLGQVARAAVWDLVSACAVAAALVAVVSQRAVSWLLLPLVLGYAVYVLPNLPGRGPGGVPRDLRPEMTHFFRLSLVQTLATAGFLQLSMVAAHGWDRPGSGSFAAAMTLATPASLISRSLQLTLFPRMAQARGSGDLAALRRQTDLSTRLLLVLCLGVYGALMLASQLIMRIFFPAVPGPAAGILAILLAAVMVQNAVVGATNDLLSRDQRSARVVTTWAVVGALAGALAWVVLAPGLGATGVALGYLVGNLVMALPPVVRVWRDQHLPWAGPVLRFVLVAVVVATATGSLVMARPSEWWGAVAALVFVLTWTTLSWRDLSPLLRRGSRQATGSSDGA